jgi:hypothetical protein
LIFLEPIHKFFKNKKLINATQHHVK